MALMALSLLLVQLHLERLSKRQHRDRVIYGLAD